MTNIDLLRINATKARQESNKTNTLKGCLSYVEKKQTKQHKIYNNLINTLISLFGLILFNKGVFQNSLSYFLTPE